jgi:uncharacterized oxidoreductase
MNMANNVVLITGGGSGIGLALGERFARSGSEVVLTGRRMDRLNQASARSPRFHVRQCDVSQPAERVALRDWVLASFPKLNVLVNNAGVMRSVDYRQAEAWEESHREIATNLEAPIHLSALLAPHLAKQEHALIVNVTSGLAFAPMARVGTYCATKAALHSYSLSLRHQLAPSGVRVVELAPPLVNTDLGAPGANTAGVALDTFADAAFKGLEEEQLEITYGSSTERSRASRAELDVWFKRLNGIP